MIDYNEKYLNYIGIDEVARGNFFGPLIFVGVDLKVHYSDLKFAVDSKTTNKKQRKELFDKIKDKVDYHIIEISPKVIDLEGLSKSIKIALDSIIKNFPNKKFIYDGKSKFGIKNDNLETEVKADSKIISVSCASIIAKHFLDNKMEIYHNLYPEYGFNTHSGYATKKHIEAVKKYGFLPQHRLSYNVKELEHLK